MNYVGIPIDIDYDRKNFYKYDFYDLGDISLLVLRWNDRCGICGAALLACEDVINDNGNFRRNYQSQESLN